MECALLFRHVAGCRPQPHGDTWTLSARLGFAAQFLFASWGGLNQPGHAVPVLVINGLPAVLGAAWFVASG